MPISEAEWASIRSMIETVSTDVSGNRGFFTTGQVIKRDPDNMLVWVEEFGDQPIPIVTFEYDVKYYDTTSTGAVNTKTSKAKIVCPKIGDTVLVARELGSRRLPRCLGVIVGKGWIVPESE